MSSEGFCFYSTLISFFNHMLVQFFSKKYFNYKLLNICTQRNMQINERAFLNILS